MIPQSPLRLTPLLLLLPVLIAQDDCASPTPTETPMETPTPAITCVDPLWHSTWGGQELDEAWGVGLSSDGNVYVSMHRGNPAQTDGFVTKMTPDGGVLWEAWAGEEWSEQAFIPYEGDGVLYVGGAQFHSLNLWDTHAWLLRFDPEDGAPLGEPWIWTSPGWDEIDGIGVADGDVFLSGWTQGPSETQDIKVVRLDSDLNVVWETVTDFEGWDAANGHLVLLGDLVYVAGATNLFNNGEAVLAAYRQSDGVLEWSRTWGEADNHEEALGLTSDGQVLYGVGEGQVAPNQGQILVWAWSADGELLWQVDWGGPGVEFARGIQIDERDGSIIVAGITDSYGAGGNDVAMLRFAPEDGRLIEADYWGGPGNEEVHDVQLMGDRAFIAGQTSSTSQGDYDAFASAICQDPWAFPAFE